jgi:hypothetical protein
MGWENNTLFKELCMYDYISVVNEMMNVHDGNPVGSPIKQTIGSPNG